jgi:hypothetical protein
MIDNYPTSNYAGADLGLGSLVAGGQALTLPATTITRAVFYIQNPGSLSSDVYARIYNASGTMGSSAIPSGAYLYESNSISLSTIGTSYTRITFDFTDAVISAGNYVITIHRETLGGAQSNIQVDSSGQHSGNTVLLNGSTWTPLATYDTIFELYASGSGTRPIAQTQYYVQSSTTPDKTLEYKVQAETPAINKSLQYRTQYKQSAKQKSVQYLVKADLIQSTSLQYRVKNDTSKTKGLVYGILEENSLTKSLQYAIRSDASVSKSLKYSVFHESTLTKNLAYIVTTNDKVYKTLTYFVSRERVTQKSVSYSVHSTSAEIVKSLLYRVYSTIDAITKTLAYYVTPESTTILKVIEYLVTNDNVETKTLVYSVKAEISKTKSLTYVIYLQKNPYCNNVYKPYTPDTSKYTQYETIH